MDWTGLSGTRVGRDELSDADSVSDLNAGFIGVNDLMLAYELTLGMLFLVIGVYGLIAVSRARTLILYLLSFACYPTSCISNELFLSSSC